MRWAAELNKTKNPKWLVQFLSRSLRVKAFPHSNLRWHRLVFNKSVGGLKSVTMAEWRTPPTVGRDSRRGRRFERHNGSVQTGGLLKVNLDLYFSDRFIFLFRKKIKWSTHRVTDSLGILQMVQYWIFYQSLYLWCALQPNISWRAWAWKYIRVFDQHHNRNNKNNFYLHQFFL